MATDEAAALITDYLARGKNHLQAVIAGKLGTGKSTLINGVIGEKVAKESHTASAETLHVTSYKAQLKLQDGTLKKSLNVTVWDTPGLGDPFLDEKETIKQIRENCSNSDLLLYCLDMRGRMAADDVQGITGVTEALGREVWKNAVIILTFGNQVKSVEEGKDTKDHFQTCMSSWEKMIKKVFQSKLDIPEDIIQEVPIVPTGYRHYSPPDRKDWFSPFWLSVFQRTKRNAQFPLLAMNKGRMRVVKPGEEFEPIDQELHKMPINVPAENADMCEMERKLQKMELNNQN